MRAISAQAMDEQELRRSCPGDVEGQLDAVTREFHASPNRLSPPTRPTLAASSVARLQPGGPLLQVDQLIRPTDLVSGSTKIARIRGDQIEFELEKAERGMALPYDVGQLRNRLREARKRKVSAALKARRGECQATPRDAAAGRIVT